MTKAVVIAVLLLWSPAVARGDDGAARSSASLGRAIFCSSVKDHGDCLAGCALRPKDIRRYRACTAACTSLYCPTK